MNYESMKMREAIGKMKKKTIVLLLLIALLMSVAGCHDSKSEPSEKASEPETTEITDTVDSMDAPVLSETEQELVGVWGEPKGNGHVIRINEDGTLAVYEYEGDSPDGGDLVHTRDGSWNVEGDEVCIKIEESELYYSFDGDNHDCLVDREMLNIYTRLEDDGSIPE